MSWGTEGNGGAPAPVETAGQQLQPPASWSASGGLPPPMTAEEMTKALENSRRLKAYRVQVLMIWLQSQHKRAGVAELKQSADKPYFEEWALHELWQISGGGAIECVQQPKRVETGGGHYYYECIWRARHRYLGTVDGHGIASSGDAFLGTNEAGRAKAESEGKPFDEKRPLGAVNPHNIAQAASTRAKRSALEEILGTQGYTWPDLDAIQAGKVPADGPGEPRAQAPAPAPTPNPASTAASAPGPKPASAPAPAAASAAGPAPVGLTPEQLAQRKPPAGWTAQPGPEPKMVDGQRIAPLGYLASQVVNAKLVTPEELMAHARLRHGFKGEVLKAADPALITEIATDVVACLRWVKAALPAMQSKQKKIEDDIPF